MLKKKNDISNKNIKTTRETEKALAKFNKELSAKPNNSIAALEKMKYLFKLGRLEEISDFLNTLPAETIEKFKAKKNRLFVWELVCAFAENKIVCNDVIFQLLDANFNNNLTAFNVSKEKYEKDKAKELQDGIERTEIWNDLSYYNEQMKNIVKKMLDDILKSEQSETVKITEEKNEILETETKSFKEQFSKMIENCEYMNAFDLFVERSNEDRRQRKHAFKLATYFYGISDFEKSKILNDYCLKASPRNPDYLNFKNDLEEKLGIIQKRVEEIQNIDDDKDKNEIKLESTQEIKNSSFKTKESFRKYEDILPLFQNANLQLASEDFEAIKKTEYYEQLRNKYDDHTVMFSFARFFNQKYGNHERSIVIANAAVSLAMQKPGNDKKIEKYNAFINEVLQTQNEIATTNIFESDAKDVEPANKQQNAEKYKKNDLYERMNSWAIPKYLPLVNEYVNDGQFKHKLNQKENGVAQEIVAAIKNKLAEDLKFLDFEIREKIIPYIIKIESSIRYGIYNKESELKSVVNKAISDINNKGLSDDFLMIFNLDKLQIDENSILFNQNANIYIILLHIFSKIRNHIAHGYFNIFDLSSSAMQTALKVSPIHKNMDEFNLNLIQNYESTTDEYWQLKHEEISVTDQMDAFFELDIVKKILSEEAIKNRKIFGFIFILLYLSNSDFVFREIVASIDKAIKIFTLRTGYGTGKKLCQAIGLNYDWTKAFVE